MRRRLRAAEARARRVLQLSGEPAPPTAAAPAAAAPAPPAPTEPPAPDPAAAAANSDPPLLCWPLDHFYSPVPNNRVLAREPARSRVWPATPSDTPGIDWHGADQVRLLQELGAQSPIVLPDGPTDDPREYHVANEMFARLDGWVLQGMLRHFRPRRMIEVGCGWSSLLTARINREYLDGKLHFTCIEPYPPDFLTGGVDGISLLIASPVEEVGIEPFLELGEGDVLFIDSSHTVKTGGDVQFLYAEVLPRLARGVVVHIHDIGLPRDYPPEWVLVGRAWNEQYLVASFLAFNSDFRVLLGVSWLSVHQLEMLAATLPNYPDGYGDGGASLWIQRTSGMPPRSDGRSRQTATQPERQVGIGGLVADLPDHRRRLADARSAIGDSIAWYPYDILGNLTHVDQLLHDEHRDLTRLAQGLPVADIGGADGDLAFALERSCGWTVDMVDTPATNMNGLRGARALAEHLGSSVRIGDIDLDAQFRLPSERYGLVFLLGILYHLQNPFYALAQLSRQATHCILSTRVAQVAGAESTRIAELPVGYLVAPDETNNDATNYWMFSPVGLRRLAARAGWTVLEETSFGDVERSDPSSSDHDERAFMLLRSTAAGG
jgi:hypothetical protein